MAATTRTQHRDIGRYDLPEDGGLAWAECERLAKSRVLVPEIFHGKPEELYALSYFARSLDISMWTALHGIYLTDDGKPNMLVKVGRGLAERAGYVIDVIDADNPDKIWRDKRAQVSILAPGEKTPLIVAYDYIEAQRNGSADREIFKMNPVASMIARCTGRALNWKAAAVLSGITVADREALDGGDDTYATGSTTVTVAPPAGVVKGISALAQETAEAVGRVRTLGGLNKLLGKTPQEVREVILPESFGGMKVSELFAQRMADFTPGKEVTVAKKTAAKAPARIKKVELMECGCPVDTVVSNGGVHPDGCTQGRTAAELLTQEA